MDLGLNDKVALVMAGSRGIGRAIVWALANEGARVAVCSREPETVFQVQHPLAPDVRARVTTYVTDLRDATQYDGLVDRVVADHGRLDVLIANTPGPRLAPYLAIDMSAWDDAYAMLVRPCLRVAHDAADQMAKQGSGSIVFMTSTWVKQPVAGSALSSAMRSALSAAAKQMALELGPAGVRVNQVMPGTTVTDRMEGVVADNVKKNHTTREVELAKITSAIPLGRCADPQEIADFVAFLVSARATFITGATMQIDGGRVSSTL